jgi:hypothetical protein
MRWASAQPVLQRSGHLQVAPSASPLALPRHLDSKVAPCVSGSGKDLFFLDYREKEILRCTASARPIKIYAATSSRAFRRGTILRITT